MITFPRAGYYIAASRLRPRLDGGYTVAALRRALDFERFGGVAPTLLTVDFGAPYAEALAEFGALGLAHAGSRIRNLWDDAQADRSWLLAAAAPVAERSEGMRYTEYRDPSGAVVLALPFVQRPDWHLTTEPIEVYAGGEVVGSYAGFAPLYRAWVSSVLDADGFDDHVIVSEARQVGELLRGGPWSLVHTVHNAHTEPPYDWDSAMDLLWTQWFETVHDYDSVVWLTEAQKTDAERRFGADDRWRVIAHPAIPAPHSGAPRDLDRVVMITRLAPMKRVDDAIRAFALVVAQRPGARLEIIGEGPLRSSLEELVADLGLADSVRLRGHVDDAASELDTAAALLLTSRYEGQSLAITEALAHGCPAISYDVHYGPAELIADGQSGYLVAAGDTAGLADRILSLLGDADAVERMSRAGRAWAADHDQRAAVARWAELFTTLLPTKTALEVN